MSTYEFYTKPKSKLFFDIETIPAKDENKEAAVRITLNKITQRNPKTKITSKLKDFAFRQSAISGDFGRIFCIGYAINDQDIEIINGTEQEILKEWWEVANQADLFIGHNIMDFDLRFFFKRSIVNNIKPAAKHLNLSFARYRNFPIFDTMREWEKWSSNYISLDSLAKILDLPTSKDNIDGSQVYDYYLKRKYKDIYNYCKKDVILTRNVYKRMVFENV